MATNFIGNEDYYTTLPNGGRMTIGTPGATQGAYDQATIQHLGLTEEERRRKVLEEQKGIQSKRLTDLASLLASQSDSQFNRDIPSIANTAQGQGMLETSGFGNALSRDYTNLKTDTNNKLLAQGLSDRDFEVASLGDISNGTGDFNSSALGRKFSVEDNFKAEQLARELGKMGVSAPASKPSTTDQLINNAGPILSGVGAVKGA